MVLAGWHETLACRWISGQYIMSQKASKSNSLNSLNQFWPLNMLRFSAISTKILLHVDVIIKDLLHVLGQKLCPCKLPQRAFVLSLDEQKYCMWTHCSVRSWVINHAFFAWKTVISTQKLVDISKQSWGSLWLVFALRLVDYKDTSEHRWVRFCYKAAIVCHLQPQRGFQEPMKMREERRAIWWSLT